MFLRGLKSLKVRPRAGDELARLISTIWAASFLFCKRRGGSASGLFRFRSGCLQQFSSSLPPKNLFPAFPVGPGPVTTCFRQNFSPFPSPDAGDISLRHIPGFSLPANALVFINQMFSILSAILLMGMVKIAHLN
jgi:hypothetical protein